MKNESTDYWRIGNFSESLTDQYEVTTYGLPETDYRNSENCTGNNCTYYISNKNYLSETFYFAYIGILMIIFIVGIIGNLLVLYVIAKHKHMRNSTNILLANLAIADLLFLGVYAPTYCIPAFAKIFDYQLGRIFGFLQCNLMRAVGQTAFNVSSVIIMCITLDRFCAVFWPLRARSLLTTKRGLITSVVTWLLVGGFNSCLAFTLNVRDDGSCVPAGEEWNILSLVIVCINIFLFYLIPFFIVTVAYSMIIWKMAKEPDIVASGNEQSNDRDRKEVIKMTAVVFAMYFLLLMPARLVNISILIDTGLFFSKMSIYFSLAFIILTFVNSVVNPIIYQFMSQRFRENFRKVFAQCFKCRLRARPDYPLGRVNPGPGP